ncbi:iron chaperone [Parapedobacter pyrenivorans]|uniref:iron chaperone n=1 Tax=Parapedobacter pyrenivorans TaxID=1305674 RepID=UPI0033406851
MESAKKTSFNNVEEYLASVADARQRSILERVRTTIKRTVPDAEETISYQMPAYRYHGILLYFAAWKNHWGLYPASNSIKETFRDELAHYKQTKGAIQFPWDDPFPDALLIKLIKKRVEENRTATQVNGAANFKTKK